jgi:hypothetical protein
VLVGVEKLLLAKFAKIKSHQEAPIHLLGSARHFLYPHFWLFETKRGSCIADLTASINTARRGAQDLESLEEGHEVRLLLRGETQIEALVIEINDVAQGCRCAVVEVGRPAG